MIISPCAMLITPMTPKVTDRPMAASSSTLPRLMPWKRLTARSISAKRRSSAASASFAAATTAGSLFEASAARPVVGPNLVGRVDGQSPDRPLRHGIKDHCAVLDGDHHALVGAEIQAPVGERLERRHRPCVAQPAERLGGIALGAEIVGAELL